MVVPSLPGFAFSSAPKQKGFGMKQVAKTLNQLMLELGYHSYVAQGVGALMRRQPHSAALAAAVPSFEPVGTGIVPLCMSIQQRALQT